MIGFENPELMLLSLLLLPLIVRSLKFRPLKRIIAILTVLAAFSLITAAAGMGISAEETGSEVAELVLVEDQSMSSQLINKEDLEAEDVVFDRRTVNSDRENFDSQVENLLEPNETYLFVSDLQTDINGIDQSFEEKNASVNLLREEMEEEHSIVIEGPDEAVIGAENSYTAQVSSTNGTTSMTVGKGEEVIYSGTEEEYEFDLTFDEPGYEQIWAEIEADDVYGENNEYFKTVKIREKPELLVIGGEGSLETELEEFYEIDYASTAPEYVEEYDTVLMKESQDNQELRNYLIEGGGLVYTGNDYNADYIPVNDAEMEEETDAATLIVLIDISVGAGEYGAAEAAKSISHELVDSLPSNTRLGVVAYNDYSYDVIDPVLLSEGREEAKDKISRLEPGGPTFHDRGMRGANSMIRNNDIEDGNIVMLTDGKISDLAERRNVARETQREVSRSSARLITVGVGEEFPRELEEEDREFLTDLAERTEGGFYVEGHSAEQLEFTFDAGDGAGEMNPLAITDSTHFITRGHTTEASIIDMDGSETKSGANELVETVEGQPFLTTWRYGTGRVAAFSGDNQDMEELMDQDPGLAGRTFSWTTGPMERDKWIEGETVRDDFRIYSREQEEGFVRQSEERYYNELSHNETGFYEESGVEYSVNYRPELQQLGYNEEVFSEFTVNGQVYQPNQIETLYEQLDTQEQTSDNRIDLRPYLLLAALVFYLSAVSIRKRKGLA